MNVIGRGPAFGICFSYQDPRQGASQMHSEERGAIGNCFLNLVQWAIETRCTNQRPKARSSDLKRKSQEVKIDSGMSISTKEVIRDRHEE